MSNQLYTPATFNSGSLSSQHNNTQILNILNIKDNKMLNHVYRSVKSNYFNSCLVCSQPHNAKIHRMICKLCNLDITQIQFIHKVHYHIYLNMITIILHL